MKTTEKTLKKKSKRLKLDSMRSSESLSQSLEPSSAPKTSLTSHSSSPVPIAESPSTIESDSFSAIVEDAKKNIQSEPKKETRGRKRLPRDANGNVIRTDQVAPPPPTPMQSTPTPSMARELVAPLKLICSIPARKTGIAELALDQSEAELLADSVDGMIRAWIPSLERMSPKAAASLGFGLVASSLFITKYQIYLEKRPAPQALEPEPEKQSIVKEDQKANPMMPNEFFRQKNSFNA